MSGRAGLVVCPDAKLYDHGPGHPLRPQRVLLTWDLIEALGLLERPNVERLGCVPATEEELRLVLCD
jgi:acetoin utilization deacetylase AcuC-like enzyme